MLIFLRKLLSGASSHILPCLVFVLFYFNFSIVTPCPALESITSHSPLALRFSALPRILLIPICSFYDSGCMSLSWLLPCTFTLVPHSSFTDKGIRPASFSSSICIAFRIMICIEHQSGNGRLRNFSSFKWEESKCLFSVENWSRE